MAIKDFFIKNIRNEEMVIKSNKEAVFAVSALECFLGGAMVLGTMSGIFTLPTFLAVTIPGLFGVSMLKETKNNIKDAKSRIENLKRLEENGVNASRNHERHKKLEELKEEKNKEIKKNSLYSKIMLGGIGAFAIGGFAPFAAALSLPLMIGGYGTMLYGLYKSDKSSDQGRNLQNQIERLKDSIAVANINPRIIVTQSDEEGLNVQNKRGNNKQSAQVKNSKNEAIVDHYIENLANQTTNAETIHKTK